MAGSTAVPMGADFGPTKEKAIAAAKALADENEKFFQQPPRPGRLSFVLKRGGDPDGDRLGRRAGQAFPAL